MKYFASIFLALIAFSVMAQLPDNMYKDIDHTPFSYGVTSGDPLPDAVIIWTKVDTTIETPVSVTYEVSGYTDFSYILKSGTILTDSNSHHTVKIDVTGLSPATIYYYRFKTNDNKYSVNGRTRTAPLPTSLATHYRFAVTSCSSIYSGYFNSYKRIAERTDIDFIMHLGDYLYDFVDSDEEVRVPTPVPTDPDSKKEWRERHEYYLLDPDLREARRMHPWIVVWDNHDLSSLSATSLVESMEAFYEYVPIRQPDINDPSNIYRKFQYGALIDVFMIDMYTKRNIDLVNSTEYHTLGQAQDFWLRNELSNSFARWKIVGNQKMMAGWSVDGLPSWFPGNGNVLDDKSWDGYDAARDHLLTHIRDASIDNVVFLTGDAHVTLVADLSDDPYDSGNYSGSNGQGSIACEFLPTSITRGNFDEMGISSFLLPLATGLSESVNPNHVHSEFTSHGYGIVDISVDTLVAELWYSDILSQTNSESFNEGYYILNGKNHWERGTLSAPTAPKDTTVLVSVQEIYEHRLSVYPNPTKGLFYLTSPENESLVKINGYQIISVATGKVILAKNYVDGIDGIEIDASDLPGGVYSIIVTDNISEGNATTIKFVKI